MINSSRRFNEAALKRINSFPELGPSYENFEEPSREQTQDVYTACVRNVADFQNALR